MSSVQVFRTRLASFGHLGLISDPHIFAQLQNGINDPKGQDKNLNYDEGQGDFYSNHTVPIIS